MSYKCGICRSVVPSGPMRKHYVYREVMVKQTCKDPTQRLVVREDSQRQIAEEIPICGSCGAALRDGVTLAELRKRFAPPPTWLPENYADKPVKPGWGFLHKGSTPESLKPPKS